MTSPGSPTIRAISRVLRSKLTAVTAHCLLSVKQYVLYWEQYSLLLILTRTQWPKYSKATIPSLKFPGPAIFRINNFSDFRKEILPNTISYIITQEDLRQQTITKHIKISVGKRWIFTPNGIKIINSPYQLEPRIYTPILSVMEAITQLIWNSHLVIN